MVLNTGPMNWESSTLKYRPLLHNVSVTSVSVVNVILVSASDEILLFLFARSGIGGAF